MKKLLVRLVRQSPAMIVAMLALFVALTGTAVATTSALITGKQIKNSSITGLDVKNRSLTPRDFRGSVRGARGPAGPQGLAGPQGAQGAQGTQGPAGPGARWAVAQPDGTIVLQSGGITSTKTGTGTYRLEFGSDVSKHLIMVSPGPASDTSFRGSTIAGSCSAPAGSTSLIGCNVPSPETKVFVGATAPGDAALQDHSFYVAVIGPASAGAAAALDASPGLVGPFAGS